MTSWRERAAAKGVREAEPSPRRRASGVTAGLVSDSALISAGTVISRLTGVARVLVIPAVFGATALGDMFLATNSLPITLFAMFGGQALVSVLVPALVRRLNESVHLGQRLAQTALGAVMMATAVLAVLGVAFHRVIAGLLAAGVDQASGARSIAAVLLLFIVPQVVLYGMVAVFVAVQHAHGKFFLASFAPAVENGRPASGNLVRHAHSGLAGTDFECCARRARSVTGVRSVSSRGARASRRPA